MTEFTGFSQEGVNFLQSVKINNSQEWFQENREIYGNELVKPFRALIDQLSPSMLKIDQHLEVKPAIGKTLSRINRDTRFSRNKLLYRDRLWLTFKRPSRDWKESPAYFFEIAPDMYRYGLGYYSAPRSTMDLFRNEIKQNPEKFQEMLCCIKKPFELLGDSYKRSLSGDLPDSILTWYNRKNFAVMVTNTQIQDTFDQNLVVTLEKGFRQISSLYDYLMKIEMMKKVVAL